MLYQDYIHKITVVLQDNFQCESHKPYGPPTSVTWHLLLRKQKNTGKTNALNAETHCSTRTRIRADSRLVTWTEAQ